MKRGALHRARGVLGLAMAGAKARNCADHRAVRRLQVRQRPARREANLSRATCRRTTCGHVLWGKRAQLRPAAGGGRDRYRWEMTGGRGPRCHRAPFCMWPPPPLLVVGAEGRSWWQPGVGKLRGGGLDLDLSVAKMLKPPSRSPTLASRAVATVTRLVVRCARAAGAGAGAGAERMSHR